MKVCDICMKKVYDLAIVGAGPAGLMTAKTASEMGLSVIIIEMKKAISKVNRACSAQFITDENYEKESIKIKGNKVIFEKNGFYINYTGPLLNIIDNYYHSPCGHKIHFAHPDYKPFAIKFDKGRLLQDLWTDCEKNGVELRLSTIAYGGKDLGDSVTLYIKNNGKSSVISSKKLVIAEGANAKLTGKFGLNKDRMLFGTPFVFSCVMEGTNGFEPQSWNQFYGNKLHPFSEVIVESAINGNDAVEVTVMGTKDLRPNILFKNIISDSPLSSHFTNARIIEKRGCSLKSYASLKRPFKNNVLVIGDSAAHVEVIVQGALMCGYHAANAIKDELNGLAGFEKYTSWWNTAFDFNHSDPLEFVKLYGSLSMRPKYTDEELDYLFSLLDNKVLNGNFSQFQIPKTVWKAILPYKNKIQNEKPSLFNKIKSIDELNFLGKI